MTVIKDINKEFEVRKNSEGEQFNLKEVSHSKQVGETQTDPGMIIINEE